MITPGRYADQLGIVIEVHGDQHLTVHYPSYAPLHEGHPDPRQRLVAAVARERRKAIVSGRAVRL